MAISGNVVYPSIGSIVAHQRRAANSSVPAYMLKGYPNLSRGPGFLGAKSGFVDVTDTTSGPAGFTRPEDVSSDRAAARFRLLEPLQNRFPEGSSPADYRVALAEALRLAGPEFMRNFRLEEESNTLRQRYGGQFGQRCLLARRLVQSGVRFLEVSHNLNFINGTGWDSHNTGQLHLHGLIQELDTALSTSIEDQEQQRMLDKTLIVVATEFGRPAACDGGGLNHQGAYGATDDNCKLPVESPVSIPDFHATIRAALGINPRTERSRNCSGNHPP